MATVELASGRIIQGAKLTDIRDVGEEGSRSATAHIDGKAYHVYNSIVDGFNDIWYEQIDLETWRNLTGNKTIVEGSVEQDR